MINNKLSRIILASITAVFGAVFSTGCGDRNASHPIPLITSGESSACSVLSSFRNLFQDDYIDSVVCKYSVNLVSHGAYQDYEGDIGKVIDAYRDIDLDGDGRPDHIFRERSEDDNCCYQFQLSSGSEFKTVDFTTLPNEGELIEFHDADSDGIDEILVSHYTFGTGGASVWNSWIYFFNNEIWNTRCLDDLGENNDPVSLDISDGGLLILLDHGIKEGGTQVFDFEGVETDTNWMNPDITTRSKDTAKNNWPVEYSLQSS